MSSALKKIAKVVGSVWVTFTVASVAFLFNESTGPVKYGVDKLGIPNKCITTKVSPNVSVRTCYLEKYNLENLKFETKDDVSSITVDGLTGNDKVALRMIDLSHSNEKIYYLVSKDKEVKIKGIKGQEEVALKKDVEVYFKEKKGGKLELDSVEVNSLGIPKRCAWKCELTKEQLEKIKFDTQGGSSISVEGLDEKNKVFLKTIYMSNDKKNTPRKNGYVLMLSGDKEVKIKGIKGKEEVSLKKDVDVYFREKKDEEKLELDTVEVDSLGIPKRCEAESINYYWRKTSCQLWKKQLEKIKFETKNSGTPIKVESMGEDDSVNLHIEYEVNYPKGKKYYLVSNGKDIKITGIKGEDNIYIKKDIGVYFKEKKDEEKLEWITEEVDSLGIPKRCEVELVADFNDKNCRLWKKQLEKIKFETKNNSTPIKVEGMSEDDTVELRIEYVWRESQAKNYPNRRKYYFSTNDKNIKITGIKGKNSVYIKKDIGVYFKETGTKDKLERVPEEVDNLGIPKRCNGKERCELTQEQLEKIKFETKSGVDSISVEGMNEDDTVELRINGVIYTKEGTNHIKKNEYYLVSKDKEVKIKGIKGKEEVSLKKDVDFYFREKKDEEKLEFVLEEVDNLGIPKRCEYESVDSQQWKICWLWKKQLEKIKFETKDDDTQITIEGMDEDDSIELKIKHTDDKINYPLNKKYTFINKLDKEIKIKGIKEKEDVLLKKDVEVYFREKQDGGKLEWIPEEIDSLGIPKKCEYGCELTQEQLKKIKFETKVDDTPITIEGMDENDTVELRIRNIASYNKKSYNYPKGKKYTFINKLDKEIKIKGIKEKEEISLKKDVDVDFIEKQDESKLKWIPEEVDDLGIPVRCERKERCELTQEQLQRLKFEEQIGLWSFLSISTPITIEGMGKEDTVELQISNISSYDKESYNYPKGKKYTLKSTKGKVTIKNTTDGNIEITEKGVDFREKQDGDKLETAEDSLNIPKGCKDESYHYGVKNCQLQKKQLEKIKFDGDDNTSISIEGMGENDTVSLKVEDSTDKTNYPKGKKYTFINKLKKEIKIKGIKGQEGVPLKQYVDVYFREKQDGGKLEWIPEEVDNLGIPKRCNSSGECKLTKKQLEKIKFVTESGVGSITVEEMNEDDTVELRIRDIKDDEKTYPKKKRYYFVSKNKDIKITGIKNQSVFYIKKDVDVYFRETKIGGKLEKALEEVNDLGIPKRCNYYECELTKKQLKEIKFETKDDGASISIEEMDEDDTVWLNNKYMNDKKNYPNGKIYYLESKDKEIKITGIKGQNDIVLKKDVYVYFKEKEDGSKLVLDPGEVDSLGIPKRCNSSRECKLTKKQLEKIKFVTESGVDSITVKEMNEDDTVWLNNKDIYIRDNKKNYPNEKIYYLESKDKEIKIKGIKGKEEISLKKDVYVYFKEKEDGSKLELDPGEVDSLGIPKICTWFCKLTKKQLEKIKFETKDDGTPISIEGMGEDDTVRLYIDNANGETNYPKGKIYYLESKDKEIKIKGIKGKEEISLKKDVYVYFKEKEDGSKLELDPGEVDSLGIPKRCTWSCKLTKKQLEKIKFETESGVDSISIEEMDKDDTVRLYIDNANGETNYPKGKKYSLRSWSSKNIKITGIKGQGDIFLKNNEVYFREKQDEKKLEFVSIESTS